MFLGPRALLNTRHVHCFSKKPWCWINAKVKLSVLRCGQVELFLSFRVRFECSRVINVSWQVLYRSLSKISIETLKMKLTIQWCCATRRLKSLFIQSSKFTYMYTCSDLFWHGCFWLGVWYLNVFLTTNLRPIEVPLSEVSILENSKLFPNDK